jgi:DNA-binding NtrC family response regulator
MDRSQDPVSVSASAQARLNLLVVDDDLVTRELLREVFAREGFPVTLASCAEEALKLLESQQFPIVLSDIRMLELDGMALLSEIKRRSPTAAVILMTGFGTMETAIQAIQKGAFDYISKPFKIDEIKALLARAEQHARTQIPVRQAPPHKPIQTRALTGKSPKIVEVYKTLARATLSDSNVLIIGESGTGKELVARAIHENSSRSKRPFIAINCGALAEGVLESELFGHVKGAFTGALADKQGIFQEANGGTLFLDEIGDVSQALQVKLLRALQEGEARAVGSSATARFDVRVLAATHRDLSGWVREGKFREDLYYRLKVVSIEIPPLRERMEDLPELVDLFISRFSERSGKSISHASPEAMMCLQSYSWPGNVRELEHAIEHAIAMSRTHILFPEDFSLEIQRAAKLAIAEVDTTATTASPASLEDLERTHILKILQQTGYNKSRTAELLGIDRATLYRKAQRYGIPLGERS